MLQHLGTFAKLEPRSPSRAHMYHLHPKDRASKLAWSHSSGQFCKLIFCHNCFGRDQTSKYVLRRSKLSWSGEKSLLHSHPFAHTGLGPWTSANLISRTVPGHQWVQLPELHGPEILFAALSLFPLFSRDLLGTWEGLCLVYTCMRSRVRQRSFSKRSWRNLMLRSAEVRKEYQECPWVPMRYIPESWRNWLM